MTTQKVIRTDKTSYDKSVESGLWIPKGNVKFNRGMSGIVEADVTVKGRKSLLPATIIITNYFPNANYR
jgi:hypothetical protein